MSRGGGSCLGEVKDLGEVEDAGEMWVLSRRGIRCMGEVNRVVWAVEISGRVSQGGWWGHGDFWGRAQDLWRSLAEGHNGRDLGAVITFDGAG